ncbi:hypothetical protein BY457_11490 [Marinilabilia salmonicolor]|jgi:hypothetical protein|uniref:hypothetical protein n=1 Tax=Marinilabilia salmonicolor TaxID=989 RepID=UPI000D0632EE|nr:hypothetical protein [Marinilabilia salmonicolor]PRY96706.1 hypothetical protein BY457_11490 [Marinilabilia salmonicolor]
MNSKEQTQKQIEERREQLKKQIKESERIIVALTEELFTQMSGPEITEHLQETMMAYYNPIFPQTNVNDVEDLRLREVADVTFANSFITKMLSRIGKEWENIEKCYGNLTELRTLEKLEKQSA